MKKKLIQKLVWIFLILLVMLNTGSALAGETGPAPEGDLIIQEGLVSTHPEQAGFSSGAPQNPAALVRPGDDPSLMTWTTLIAENFDGTFPYSGWEFGSMPDDTYIWGQTSYWSHSPDMSVYPAAGGTNAYDPRDSYYKNYMLSYMDYGPIDLSTATDARLEFTMWLDTEPYSDRLGVCVSPNGTNFSCYGYSGSTGGWRSMSLNLSDWGSLGSSLMGDSTVWISFEFLSNDMVTGPGVYLDNLVVRSTASSAEPDLTPINYIIPPNLYHPGDSFASFAEFINVGSADCTSYDVDEYLSSDADITTGDIQISAATIAGPIGPGEQWYTVMAPSIPFPIPAGMYYVGVMYSCVGDNETSNDTLIYANPIEVADIGLNGLIFLDSFESRDFASWTRFNDGKTGLSACSYGALGGEYGACFYRPPGNDKRRQLIDETPVSQTTFNVRFSFDINGLSMSAGERFRFMQVKMGPERPFFIVLLYSGGQYQIQLNTLQDDLTKVKTNWYVLSDAPHVIEVDWQASSGPGANDGHIELYLDGALLEDIAGLDSDTVYVDSFKIGYTSRLEGKSIAGTFFVDDVATGNGGYIGVP